jgi:acylphosphatase
VCDNYTSMIVARHHRLSGRVQRVGFRYFVYDAAYREGVAGWVRNLPDGSVEVDVEGEADAIERFEMALRQGPPGARVEDVETDITPPTGRRVGFMIR